MRKCRNHWLDDVQSSQHCSHKQVKAPALADQEQPDVSSSHMSCTADRHFKVAAAPVPRGIQQAWCFPQQAFVFSRSPCAATTNSFTSSGFSGSGRGLLAVVFAEGFCRVVEEGADDAPVACANNKVSG